MTKTLKGKGSAHYSTCLRMFFKYLVENQIELENCLPRNIAEFLNIVTSNTQHPGPLLKPAKAMLTMLFKCIKLPLFKVTETIFN